MEIPICNAGKLYCSNCNSRFVKLRPMIKEIIINKHFEKDLKNKEERDDIINDILRCDAENYREMHKFEFSTNDNYVFRAKKGSIHIVYSISGSKLLFLRAIKNFKEYQKFLNSEINRYLIAP